MMRILIIEDEKNVADFLRSGLTEEGYLVSWAPTGEEGLRLLEEEMPDLLILDLILPDIHGAVLCRQIRQRGFSELPVLMLTALGSSEQVVSGLDSGADDYLVKPFKFAELLARIRALRRRKHQVETTHHKLTLADLEMDLEAQLVTRAGREIRLTSTEFRLLRYLLQNAGKVLSRQKILENVWSINFDLSTNVVDVYVNYLRNKVDKPFDQRLIHTVIGLGYILREEPPAA